MRGVREGPFDIQGFDDRLIGSMSTTASCINMASNGDLPGMAPQVVGGIARYSAGATR